MSAESSTRLAETPRAADEEAPHDVVSAVKQVCWLSAEILLLIATEVGSPAEPLEAFARCGKSRVQLAARSFFYERPESSQISGHLGQAVLLRLPAGHTAADPLDFVLSWAGRSLRVGRSELVRATLSLDALLRYELAALSPSARADALVFLVAGPGEAAAPKRAKRRLSGACCSKALAGQMPSGQVQLSKSLHAARQALRERLPACVISVAAPQGLNIDAVLAVDDRNFYVQGWLHDEEAPPTRLTAVSPEGSRTEILSRLYRYRRPDVEQFYGDCADGQNSEHGWVAHLETSTPSLMASGWMFELGNAAGAELEVSAPSVIRDLAVVRETILRDLEREQLPADRLRAEHIAPALTCLEARRRSAAKVNSVTQHGEPLSDPEVSIVVPLYGRIDFLEHQLAQFIHDPEFQRVDLIYTLDSPELAAPFQTVANQLAQIYDVPFRTAVMSHNVGFSGVNNMASELARGRLLLLLNSDVFPREPGWLSTMTKFYDATPGIGALAPKLLYEDESIQHAGMYFQRMVDTGMWSNEHFYKGLHRSFPSANETRVVPAVTAACMMIDLKLYQDLGGLRGKYIQGDYEDSDLCLRLSAQGRSNWYLSTVELYHLEGQSYPSQIRNLTGAYNRWLHTAEWDIMIEQVMDISGKMPAS